MKTALAAGLVLLVSGCRQGIVQGTGNDAGGGGGPPPVDAGTQPDAGSGAPDSGVTHFTNVVDAVVVPMLLANGLPVTQEDPGVLCRRLAIDLTGITPNATEMAGVCSQSPGAIADYYMNKTSGPSSPGSPPYVWVNRRWWADSFQYQAGSGDASTHTFYAYDRDLDALVGELYSGAIKYDTFTRRALASPAFARRFGIFDTNHDLIQIASQAFRVFMGREAVPSEAVDFGNLWGAWGAQYWVSAVTIASYPDCASIQSGGECYHNELGVNPAQCSGLNALSCTSTVLGAVQAIPPGTAFIAYDGGFSPAVEAAMEAPGVAITAQPEWAEAAVDRALEKYLGWWEAGFYIPDYELPAVRSALVGYFTQSGYDIRALEREIVTSVLYTEQAALQTGEQSTDPIWAFGPTKQLYAEAWLDSVGQALGKQLGGCDFRYLAWYYGAQVPGAVSFPTSAKISSGYYFAQAELMGGCPIASPHGSPTGILPAATRRAILVGLCPGSFPATSSTGLTALAQTELSGIGRAGTSAEVTQAVTELEVPADGSCDPNNLSACAMQSVADGLCDSVYASAAFTFY